MTDAIMGRRISGIFSSLFVRHTSDSTDEASDVQVDPQTVASTMMAGILLDRMGCDDGSFCPRVSDATDNLPMMRGDANDGMPGVGDTMTSQRRRFTSVESHESERSPLPARKQTVGASLCPSAASLL